MDAARDLLVELGPDGLTVDAVVARSGVAKSTVYRHWKNRDDLVADVFSDSMPSLQAAPAELPAIDALRAMVRQIASSFADPGWRRLLPAMILLKTQSDAMANLNDEMRESQLELATEVFRRCVDEGVLDPVVLKETTRAGLVLIGPLLAAALVGDVGLDDDFVDEVVDRFVRAHAPA